jgi:hypothetical protein
VYRDRPADGARESQDEPLGADGPEHLGEAAIIQSDEEGLAQLVDDEAEQGDCAS